MGADLEPGTVLAAYRQGLFPMPLGRRGQLGWWSPDPRAVLPLGGPPSGDPPPRDPPPGGLRVSRSLRRSCRRYQVRFDTAFEAVVAACAAPDRDGAWISDDVRRAYVELHRLGWAHSVESWAVGPDGRERLVGGLYGVAVGGLFAGESMFHHATDASKVALVGLVERLRAAGATLLDVQWATPHLRSLGVVEVPRRRYLELLADALALPVDRRWSSS